MKSVQDTTSTLVAAEDAADADIELGNAANVATGTVYGRRLHGPPTCLWRGLTEMATAQFKAMVGAFKVMDIEQSGSG
eukprot:1446861-Prymnesium_polylepis.1